MGNLYGKFDHFFFLKPNWSKGLGPFDFLILNAWITKAICRLISWKYEIFSNMNNPILLGIWTNRIYLKNSKWNVSKCQMTPPLFFGKNWTRGGSSGMNTPDAWTNSHLVLKKRALHGHSAPRDRLNSFFGPPWAFKDKKCLDWYQFRNVLNFKESRRKMQNLVKGCIWYFSKTEVKKNETF